MRRGRTRRVLDDPMQGNDATFFEGSEKKVELSIDTSLPSLRTRGTAYWERIVRRCDAAVLSRIANAHCEAYLLSESSLFVFDHKIVMITCGRTRLAAAVLALLGDVDPGAVRFLAYERKNEVFPQGQPTSFFDDVRALNERLPGRAFQFGDEDEHHLYLFHLDRPHHDDRDDGTVEVLMYGIDPEVMALFCSPGSDTAALRRATAVDRILEGYDVDDHLFDPNGYSLNAIRGERYWALHVTPDPLRSYASFETNAARPADSGALVERVLAVFRPRSFDVVTFDRGEPLIEIDGPHELGSHVVQDLSCGYRTRFLSYRPPRGEVRQPLELPLDSVAVR